MLLVAGFDILPVDFGKVPLNLEEDDTKLRFDATPCKALAQHERGTMYQILEFVYEFENGNILTKSKLLQMQETENSFCKRKSTNNFCQLVKMRNGTTVCRPAFSILRFFGGSYVNIHSSFYDPNFLNISHVLSTAQRHNMTRAFLAYHLGKDVKFEVPNNMVSTSYCRSLLYIGWPLAGYENVQEKEDEQTKKTDDYIFTTFGSSLAKMAEEGIGEMNFYYQNLALWIKATQAQVVKDLQLAILSFVFICVFMWVQTGSLWITGWGIFSILSSFNIANLMYRIILDYRYFGVFYVPSIFIILGIGADDIFVFNDTWKQSQGVSFTSMAH